MNDSTHLEILRRMTSGSAGESAAEMPVSSSRAVRLALTKAVNDSVGLQLTVTSLSEETLKLDTMLAGLDDGLMLMALERGNDLTGLMAVDAELRAALLEMQTIGSLLNAKAEERDPTGTDKAMAEIALTEFLRALPEAINGTRLHGWVDGVTIAERIESARAAGLVLIDREYRIMRLDVDLVVAERTGQVLLILPLVQEPIAPVVPKNEEHDWGSRFRAAVSEAPASLDAYLHRFEMSLAAARRLTVGQVVPLPGCSVDSVQLESQDGQVVAEARLGQLGGKRALRLQAAPVMQMHDLGGGALAEPHELLDLGGAGELEPPSLEPEFPMVETDLNAGELADFAAPEVAMESPQEGELGGDLGFDGPAMAEIDLDALSD